MQNHLYSIQALRGIAAVLVTAFHFFPNEFIVGAAGVDIFFVISGLIMGTIGVNERPLVFLCKRIIRIAPLYWLFTFVMCLGAIAGVYSQFRSMQKHSPNRSSSFPIGTKQDTSGR